MTRALDELPFVVIDLETTGGSALFDRVLEVAAIRVQNGVVQDRFECLVEPGMPIPPFVTRITGINQSVVRGQPSFDSVLPRVRQLLDGATLVAHKLSRR
jgi:DNA polymerase-3 subunit epsilon